MSTSKRIARSLLLNRRPDGMPSAKLGEDFSIQESEAPTTAPESGLLVELHFVSADPYLRNSMRGAFELGKPIPGFVSGKVLRSKHEEWKEGDYFGANLPFVTIQQVTDLSSFLNLTPFLENDAELSLGIGLLGMPGSTAYAGLDLMAVGPEDRVWINASTGAVGSLAGQICKKVKKCRLVVGSCGSKEKAAMAVERFGYDACFDYHEGVAQLKELAPEGIDFCFENVGGDHFQAAMESLRTKGRVAICGAISGYNQGELTAKLNVGTMIYQQQRVEGFLCGDWRSGKRGEFLKDMSSWYRQGLLTREETVFQGLEKWPEAFAMLFEKGSNTHVGKVVVGVC